MTDSNATTNTETTLSIEEMKRLSALLQASGNYQVLRRFEPVDRYHDDDGSRKIVAMIIDTETTGVDPTKDKVIEIGYVMVECAPESGKVFAILDRYSGLQDPGIPLTEKIIQVTGLTDADLKGHVFDSDKIRADVARADVVIAQNASFDRGFLEVIYPEFIEKHWACTQQEGPWEEMSMGTRKQEYLAYKVAGIFYDAHRALIDAEVLLKILTCDGHDGYPILKYVLDKARGARYTVWANNAPYDKKDVLKLVRNYRWSGDIGGNGVIAKTWFLENVTCLNDEIAYLADNIYHARGRITVDKITSKERYSTRYRERFMVDLSALQPDPVQNPVAASA